MVTEDVDETKDVPISDELPEEDEESKPQTIENQEFAKDKKNKDKNMKNILKKISI